MVEVESKPGVKLEDDFRHLRAGNSFQYFSNSSTLTDKYYLCLSSDHGNLYGDSVT